MDLKALVKRLNPICFRALEQAAERSRAQGHCSLSRSICCWLYWMMNTVI